MAPIIAPLSALIPQDHSYRHLSSCARSAGQDRANASSSGDCAGRQLPCRFATPTTKPAPTPPRATVPKGHPLTPRRRVGHKLRGLGLGHGTPPPLIAATTLTSDATERKSHAATSLRLVGVRQSDDDLLPRRVLLLQQVQTSAQQASTKANLFTDSITTRDRNRTRTTSTPLWTRSRRCAPDCSTTVPTVKHAFKAPKSSAIAIMIDG